MKNLLFGLIATVLFSFIGNAQSSVLNLRTIENKSLKENNFSFEFDRADVEKNTIIGKLSIGSVIVNAEMDITTGLNISDIKNINEDEVSFINNNETLNLKIVSKTDDSTILRLKPIV
jgi:hypothetical protein